MAAKRTQNKRRAKRAPTVTKRLRAAVKKTQPVTVSPLSLTMETSAMTAKKTDTEKQLSRSFMPSLSDVNAPLWNKARRMAAFYIDTNEHLAKRLLEVHEQSLRWSKDTPWASLLHAQTNLARQWVEGSVQIARRLWRIERSLEEQHTNAKEITAQRSAAS